MFIGHYAVALAAKRIEPRVSLGTSVLAAQLADLAFPAFLVLGLEHVRIDPGATRVTPLDFYDYPFSHSLAALVVWGVLVGAVVYLARRSWRAAALIAGIVVSHWFLDLLMHRPDLPLAPGGSARLGLGLWYSLPATLVVEATCFVAGGWIYLRSTTPLDRTGRNALIALLIFLPTVWLAAVLGPPPPSEGALIATMFAVWLTVAWAYWIDRHRSMRADQGGGVPEAGG